MVVNKGYSGSRDDLSFLRLKKTCICVRNVLWTFNSIEAEMGKQRSPEQLAKFLSYILERRPDEFGLIPDKDGYVKMKDLLKAISEEEGWGYVRQAAINEVLMTVPDPPVEIRDNLVRGKNRDLIPQQTVAETPPKLLYTCVRRKAHGFVLEKGIFPQAHAQVILSSDKDMAERMGKRSDQSPILLTVQTYGAMDKGVVFYQAGETLFLADFIPLGSFTGPPLPKEKEEIRKRDKPEKEQPKMPGSFFLNLADERDHKREARKKKKDEISKTKDKRRRKQQKYKMWDES